MFKRLPILPMNHSTIMQGARMVAGAWRLRIAVVM
jgi:hypothetical protein